MNRLLVALLGLAATLCPGIVMADPAELDEWCKQVELPSSIALCSNQELRELAVQRNRLFELARERLSYEAYRALLRDHKGWIRSSSIACGISQIDPPALPLSAETLDCLRRAGGARVTYLRNYLGAPAPTTRSRPAFVPLAPPQPAPEVGFTDIEGKPVKLADFKGKLLVLNLWATWCVPCLEQMPSLEQLQINLPDRLLVIAVSEDRGGKNVVEPFLEKLGLKRVKIYLDPKEDVGGAFHATVLPASIVIGSDGKVLGKVEGATEWDSFEMHDALKPFLPNTTSLVKRDNEIRLLEENGVYKVPVTINGILPLRFILDSGAGDVSIPADVFLTLNRTGTISPVDYIGEGSYRLADGSVVQSNRFYLQELRVGNNSVKHVPASIGGVESSLLLGQSFLKRFSSVHVDNDRHLLILGNERPADLTDSTGMSRESVAPRGQTALDAPEPTNQSKGRIGVKIQDGSRGPMILEVETGGPAHRAGVQPGDVILAVNGIPVNEGSELLQRIEVAPVGREISISVLRKGNLSLMRVLVGRVVRSP